VSAQRQHVHALMPYEQWLGGGRRVRLPSLGHEVFVRLDGPEQAQPLTLLHGYPTSSHDWAGVLPALSGTHRVLSLDFLGFGDSDKPSEHRYSLLEQADLVQELWQLLEFPGGGDLLAHDYGVSVAQELLARGVAFRRVAWLNGGLYPELHRPTDGQLALVGPDGAAFAAALTPEILIPALRALLARPVPDEVLGDLANAAARRDGLRIFPQLLGYMAERREHERRWTGALEQARSPYAFMWGMRDPVSGAHMLERVRERLPGASFTTLEDVGHYPQVEAPELLAPALAAFLAP
jgi:pimeloyl-ACP methyl ester carboxylesterase